LRTAEATDTQNRFDRWARRVDASNKKSNGGPLRKGLAAGVPTAAGPASTSTKYETISRLLGAHKYNEILKVESKCHHLDHTFSDDPNKDAYVLYAFGRAIHEEWSNVEFARTARLIISKEPKSE